jgi:hypothetical protein
MLHVRSKIRVATFAMNLMWLGLAVNGRTQTPAASPLLEVGKITVAGREVSYRIRNLPVSSFPDLPAPVAEQLTARGCVIPQTYEAHHPENVVRASLEKAGSQDWAVLCSANGKIALLVFFASDLSKPFVLREGEESGHLQEHSPGAEWGFNWGIDPASPKRIHEAQAGMSRRPAMLDHDCLADSTVDFKTIYRIYRDGAWEIVDVE